MLTRRTFFQRTVGAIVLTAASFYGWSDSPVDPQLEVCETGGFLVPEEYAREIERAWFAPTKAAADRKD